MLIGLCTCTFAWRSSGGFYIEISWVFLTRGERKSMQVTQGSIWIETTPQACLKDSTRQYCSRGWFHVNWKLEPTLTSESLK